MKPIRLIVADELAMSREALKALLSMNSSFEVVGEAACPERLVPLVAELTPDAVVVSLAGRSKFTSATIESFIQARPGIRAVVLSPRDEFPFVRLLMAAGASAFVSLHSSSHELFAAIHEVAEGRTYIDTSVAGRAGQESLSKLKPGATIGTRKTTFLSKRETEVLKLLSQGFTNQQVADTLQLSVKTAETYRVRLTRKLGVRSRAELFRYAFEIGMIGPDQLVNSDSLDAPEEE